MLYTGKGDDGTTKTFGCDQRISKSSAIAEALGSVDEVNALLGVLKMHTDDTEAILGLLWRELLADVQQDLFVIQAEFAGAEKKMDKTRVEKLEGWVNAIEKELPPITTFFVSGGTALGARCDHARTVARRAERRVVEAVEREENEKEERSQLLAYMNRLSSILYALARLANHQAGVPEEKPHY
jgi:cob(I)alamin adenosyltransferase